MLGAWLAVLKQFEALKHRAKALCLEAPGRVGGPAMLGAWRALSRASARGLYQTGMQLAGPSFDARGACAYPRPGLP